MKQVAKVIARKRILGVLLVATAVSIYGAFVHPSEEDATVDNRQLGVLIITETGKAASLDPLDGDSTRNLPVARMLYRTPIEVDSKGELFSTLLSSFQYSPEHFTITLVARDDQTFWDGTPITPLDITLSILRNAYRHRHLPLISSIVGLEDWLQHKQPLEHLPKGITVNGQTIAIQLKSNVEHPLFRLTLEQYGVISRSSVDLRTNKITTSAPTGSGYYLVAEDRSDSVLFRKAYPGVFDEIVNLEKIEFRYRSLSPARYRQAIQEFSEIENSHIVLAGNEGFLSSEVLASVKTEFYLRLLPESRFTALLIHPKSLYFKDHARRRAFVDGFRSIISKENPDFPIEGSIFTRITPGYLSIQELQEYQASEVKDQSAEQSNRPEGAPKISLYPGEKSSPTIKAVFESLEFVSHGKINFDFEENNDSKAFVERFAAGKTDVSFMTSGFWAMDPWGDLKMLFTPNLHLALAPFWQDPGFNARLAQVGNSPEDLKAFNRYLFSEAYFNVYRHSRRFYAYPKGYQAPELPISISAPTPWQLFKR